MRRKFLYALLELLTELSTTLNKTSINPHTLIASSLEKLLTIWWCVLLRKVGTTPLKICVNPRWSSVSSLATRKRVFEISSLKAKLTKFSPTNFFAGFAFFLILSSRTNVAWLIGLSKLAGAMRISWHLLRSSLSSIKYSIVSFNDSFLLIARLAPPPFFVRVDCFEPLAGERPWEISEGKASLTSACFAGSSFR